MTDPLSSTSGGPVPYSAGPPAPVVAAWHEAGHALAAHHVGRRVDAVAVTPAGGQILQEPLPRNASAAEIEDALVVVAAGEIAAGFAPVEPEPPARRADPYFTEGETEAMLLEDESGVRNRPDDSQLIDRWAQQVGSKIARRARARAEILVRDEFESGRLAMLARELLRVSFLSGAELALLIEGGTE